MVVIKGCEWEVSMVMQATILVIKHMCESLAVSNLNIQVFTIFLGHLSLLDRQNACIPPYYINFLCQNYLFLGLSPSNKIVNSLPYFRDSILEN
jgi:hypothetical protein